jgi:enediyne biosynthesis protein E4
MLLSLLVVACTAPSLPTTADSGVLQPEPQAGLVEGGALTCADPDARQLEGPTQLADLGPDWATQQPTVLPSSEVPVPGAGLVVEDLTGDGLLDVFLPAYTPCQLYVGQPDGTLAAESDARLPDPHQDCNAYGASAADADQDGDLDLFVARDGAPDLLWFNDGSGHFAPSITGSGLTPHWCGSRSGTWGDPDGDGDLDLFVARHHPIFGADDPTACERSDPLPGRNIRPGDTNALYRNEGDGTFVDISATLSDSALLGYSFVAEWVDLDEDGRQDLYIINDFGDRAEPNVFLRGDGAGGLSAPHTPNGLDLAAHGMGVAVGDINDDGHPDLAISDLRTLHLLVSDSAGSWYDAATSLGLQPAAGREQVGSWAMDWVDLDHDIDLDLLVAFGPTEQLVDSTMDISDQPDGAYLRMPDGRFIDHGEAWGLNQVGDGRGLVSVDWNGDGWMDVLKVDYRSGPARLYLQRCGAAAWVTVHLDDDRAAHPVGARVAVHLPDRTLTRWVRAPGSRLASSGPVALHFGLGDHDRIDGLTVTWADGDISEFGAIVTRQHLTVVRAEIAP